MFNDDLDVLDAFQPLFGRGITASAAKKVHGKESGAWERGWGEEQKAMYTQQLVRSQKADAAAKAAAAKKRNLKKKKSGGDEVKVAQVEVEHEKDEEREKESCNFGLINLAVIFIVGIFICNTFGLFMPENIPEFITSKEELFASFPSLVPTNFSPHASESKKLTKGEPWNDTPRDCTRKRSNALSDVCPFLSAGSPQHDQRNWSSSCG